jgi:hypothetical protein
LAVDRNRFSEDRVAISTQTGRSHTMTTVDSTHIKAALLRLMRDRGLACEEQSISVWPLAHHQTPICYRVTATADYAKVLAAELARVTGRCFLLGQRKWLLFRHEAQVLLTLTQIAYGAREHRGF